MYVLVLLVSSGLSLTSPFIIPFPHVLHHQLVLFSSSVLYLLGYPCALYVVTRSLIRSSSNVGSGGNNRFVCCHTLMSHHCLQQVLTLLLSLRCFDFPALSVRSATLYLCTPLVCWARSARYCRLGIVCAHRFSF